MHKLLLIFLLSLPAFAQEMTPLDSLYASDSLGFGKRVLLKPIQLWQHVSYGNASVNCQFEKSCSNFMVESIQTKGVIGGAIIGTDRIVRCNPAARHYHLQIPDSRIQYDGRLVEPVAWEAVVSPEKSAALAVTLSIVPGLGRSYAGHPVDGMFSFILVGGFAFNTYNHHMADNPIRAGINASLMTLFWLSDIYGAYRTAKLASSLPPG